MIDNVKNDSWPWKLKSWRDLACLYLSCPITSMWGSNNSIKMYSSVPPSHCSLKRGSINIPGETCLPSLWYCQILTLWDAASPPSFNIDRGVDHSPPTVEGCPSHPRLMMFYPNHPSYVEGQETYPWALLTNKYETHPVPNARASSSTPFLPQSCSGSNSPYYVTVSSSVQWWCCI